MTRPAIIDFSTSYGVYGKTHFNDYGTATFDRVVMEGGDIIGYVGNLDCCIVENKDGSDSDEMAELLTEMTERYTVSQVAEDTCTTTTPDKMTSSSLPSEVNSMTNKITKTDIRTFIKGKLATDEAWAKKALLKVYANQTDDEQCDGTTRHNNGEGFNGTDAELLSSFARFLTNKGFLTAKQMAYVFKKMPKYWGQIAEICDPEHLHALVDCWKDEQSQDEADARRDEQEQQDNHEYQQGYTDAEGRIFADHMDNYEGEGWTPSRREFAGCYQGKMLEACNAWYDEHRPNGGHSGVSLEEAVNWGDADPVLLDMI